MANLFRAFLFKLTKDWTFRITLFIGLGMAVLMTVLYLLLDKAIQMEGVNGAFCTGQSMFLSSLSPAQNFGIAIPVNLISFTVLEFNHGTIRNKIIAGNSKGKIYLSLLLSGLCFTLIVLAAYVGLSTLLGTIFGGADINGTVVSMEGLGGSFNPEFFWKILVLAILAYALINVITIFFATLFRNIGPTISVVLLLVLALYISASVIGPMSRSIADLENVGNVMRILNPFYSIASNDVIDGKLAITNEAFLTEIINTLAYGTLFVLGGFLIFKKRDIK